MVAIFSSILGEVFAQKSHAAGGDLGVAHHGLKAFAVVQMALLIVSEKLLQLVGVGEIAELPESCTTPLKDAGALQLRNDYLHEAFGDSAGGDQVWDFHACRSFRLLRHLRKGAVDLLRVIATRVLAAQEITLNAPIFEPVQQSTARGFLIAAGP